jgi:hypothetical protein
MSQETKKKWVVKVIDQDGSRHYFGMDGNKICDPWSNELMEFAENFGFDRIEDSIRSPYSYILGGSAVTAEIIPLEIF